MPRLEKIHSKKSYEPPVLTVYGTVHNMTRTNMSRDGQDGGQVTGSTYTGQPGG